MNKMVKHARLVLDNEDFERINKYRKEKGYTWEQLVLSLVKRNDKL
jgi:hypothetical protein